MLVSVRDRVQTFVQAGKPVEEAIGSRPTAEFDERWARGAVAPDAFVRQVYQSLASEKRHSASHRH